MKISSLLPRRAPSPNGSPQAPDGGVGRVEEEIDAEACLTKGENLLARGREAEARRFLRAAPGLATARLQLVEITSRCAPQDGDFIALIAQADQARDAGRWAEGERRYAEALRLYPTHAGYMVQYAHCLKEQQKFAEAEIHYRSALALGAAPGDIQEHLDFVGARQGYREPPPARHEAATMMDAPPTCADVDLVFTLLTGAGPADIEEMLHILRTRTTIREVFVWVIKQPSFRTRNRDLLQLIADGSLQL
jgi:hypothetical protein